MADWSLAFKRRYKLPAFSFSQTLLNRIHKPEIKKTAYLYQKFNKLGITFPYISSLFKILLEKSRIGVNLCSIL